MLIRDSRWSSNADVVIVGLGGAGAVAAITAHDLGAQVLVVEKQAQIAHHSNTAISGGVFINVADVKKATAYMESLCRSTDGGPSWAGPNVIDVWASYSAENVDWVESLGGKARRLGSAGEHRQFNGWEAIETYRYAGSGLAMQNFLTSQVRSRGIQVLYGARVRRLLTNLAGEVEGVRVDLEQDGPSAEGRKSVDIRANRAVILTCGGFEFNEEMKLNYLRIYPSFFTGTTANTGDGVIMAQDVGAQLWHMNCCSARWVAKFPGFPMAFTVDFAGAIMKERWVDEAAGGIDAGFVVVDRDGKRFTNEHIIKHHTLYYELTLYDSHRLIHPRVPCFCIFDQKRLDCGRIVSVKGGPAGPSQLYKWSQDNRQELEKGWIVKADSIVDLAAKLGLPRDDLEQTVRRWNGFCEGGSDPEFGCHAADLVPLRNPPYYGVRLYPGGPNTQGGPRRNELAQVLNVDGDPIPRLYSAGELGSTFGMLYPSGGGNISECIAFGRVAGERASREKPLV